MNELKYVYGPVPSRRLGLSLGISPIPKKTCNYSCVYCQLGRTDRMSNTRQDFFPVEDILREVDYILANDISFDVITIVGEGEPTLYKSLGDLIAGIKQRTDLPVALITNGALFYDPQVRREVALADIVSPTMDAVDEESFRKINRPYGTLSYKSVLHGLKEFSRDYRGQLWLELMLVKGYNDDEPSLIRYSELLRTIRYDRLYINTPVRPPAEAFAVAADRSQIEKATELLGGTSIDLLVSHGFHSELQDDYLAIMSIIKRHPMNQYEVEGFLGTRAAKDITGIMARLETDPAVESIVYKKYITFRLR